VGRAGAEDHDADVFLPEVEKDAEVGHLMSTLNLRVQGSPSQGHSKLA